MIQPEFKSLITILNDKIFRIPEYQRHYSWQSKQRNDLFEDIQKLETAKQKYDDRIHFMATIVCLKTKDKQKVGSNTFYIHDIVDGQQRITTLVVLLKTLSIKLSENKQADEAKELDKLLAKDAGSLIILQNNHDNRSILRNYLIDGKSPKSSDIETKADNCLAEAIKDCQEFVNSCSNTIDLLELIKNHLFFVFQSLEDEGSVYTIFEVLNSRGLDVDWLDKCKNLLMGLLYEYAEDSDSQDFIQHLKELHSYWSEIYKEIGLQNIPGHEIIRFAATLKTKDNGRKLISAEDAINFFKEDCTKPQLDALKIKRIIENTLWIKKVTSCLTNLYAEKEKSAITDISQVRLLAIAIKLKELSEGDEERLLDQWERTSFKIYGLSKKDSRYNLGDYVQVAKEIQKVVKPDIVKLQKSIAKIGSNFDIEELAKQLTTSDSYNDWQKELRYFFFEYEKHLSGLNRSQINKIVWSSIWKSNPNTTIEHILPKDKSNIAWNNFTSDEHEEYLHTIGNLCLLSPNLNSEASNKSFENKKEIYDRVSLISLQQVKKYTTWTKTSIKKRSADLISFAKNRWKDLE